MDIQTALVSQYAAGLRMLRGAIERCPDSLWNDAAFPNRFWHLVYHTIFYTHLYLSRSEAEFAPWERARKDYNFMGEGSTPEENLEPYTRPEMLEYATTLEGSLEVLVGGVALDAGSGFPWIPFDRMELHLYTLRHLQHHVGQLIERLRAVTGSGVDWVGMGR